MKAPIPSPACCDAAGLLSTRMQWGKGGGLGWKGCKRWALAHTATTVGAADGCFFVRSGGAWGSEGGIPQRREIGGANCRKGINTGKRWWS